jgi:DtxR family manganese transport transcriptional regulator
VKISFKIETPASDSTSHLSMTDPQPIKRHRKTRADHASELAEDYVEAIAEITSDRGVCRAVDLAGRFGVSSVTVNRTISRLVRDGYAVTAPYAPIELTPTGLKLAKQSKKRHDIVFKFLLAIGVSESIAAIDAEGIEHHVSPETLRKLQAFTESNPPS